MMKHTLLGLLLAVLGSGFVLGQTIDKYAQTITAEDLKAHLTFLADDEVEGRATGTRGQRIAAKYIASQFMKAGLAPGNPINKGYFQEYPIANIKLTGKTVAAGKSVLQYIQDFYSPDLLSLPEEMEGEWIFVGYGVQSEEYDNLDGLEISGKNVIMLFGSPDTAQKTVRMQYAAWAKRRDNLLEMGINSLWVIQPANAYNVSKHAELESVSLVRNNDETAPVFFMSETAGDIFLKAAGSSLKTAKSALASQAAVPKMDFGKLKFIYGLKKEVSYLTASNVVGLIEGTDKKDEIVVLSAHYDHLGTINGQVYNGADDDGSGTVALIEMAEAFAKAAAEGNRPRRSILFLAVSGEEKGLWGSEYYVKHPLYPLSKTVTDLNTDMIGRIDAAHEGTKDSVNYVYIIGSDKISTELDQICKAANERTSKLQLDYTYNSDTDPNRFYYRSDHYNFAEKGIPVIFFFTGVHEDYHQHTDDIEKIRFPKAARITQLVFSTAWEVANREERLKVDVKKK